MSEPGNQLSLERERLRFCERMYELERARGDLLERRAQFYLTLLTFLLGALSLKADLWGKVRLFLWTLWRSHPVWVGSIFVEGVLCSSSAAASFLLFYLSSSRGRAKNHIHQLCSIASLTPNMTAETKPKRSLSATMLSAMHGLPKTTTRST